MSDESRFRRFFYEKTTFSAEELQRLTTADGKNHFALVMAILDENGAEADVVAVARCFRNANEPSAREVAFTTIDEWQGAGIGTALAAELARRCYEGDITSWQATFLSENKGVRKVLGSVAICESERAVGSGAVEATYRLSNSLGLLQSR